MNKGFQIEIQQNLTKDENEVAVLFANDFIIRTVKNNMNYAGRSYMRRWEYGISIGKKLQFRRLSNGLRKFGVVKRDTFYRKESNDKICWKDKKPKTYIYATIGKIKG